MNSDQIRKISRKIISKDSRTLLNDGLKSIISAKNDFDSLKDNIDEIKEKDQNETERKSFLNDLVKIQQLISQTKNELEKLKNHKYIKINIWLSK